MDIWLPLCVLGVIVSLPLHFASVEHLGLEARYGEERGRRIGEVLGVVSGWGFFASWIGIWVSPQPLFYLPSGLPMIGAVLAHPISSIHLVLAVPLISLGAWLGVSGVREVTLRVAETHRTERIVTAGVYSLVRHPQYLGALIAHIGISFLLSVLYSLALTPMMVLVVYLISWKEEQELINEFGAEYEEYMGRVPILIPKLGKR